MHIMLFPGEEEAIREVLAAGEQYGYGNLISRLKRAWAEKLVKEHGMTWEQAARGADTSMARETRPN